MFTKAKRSIIVAGLLMAFALPSFAWDEVGHKLTAYIAWQQMRPDVRTRVIKTLLAAPEVAQLSTFYSAFGGGQSEAARQRDFFMLIATWPDIIRDRNSFPVRFKNYAHSDWHYADTFWRMKDGKVEPVTDAKPSGLALDKLVDLDKRIRSNASDADKAVAIAWLEHLIGDIHQPLHASSRVTDSNTDGDQGGNLFLLTPKDTPRPQQENLHHLWDAIVLIYQPNTKDLCEAEYLYPIGDHIMKLYPYDKLKGDLADGKFDVWKDESYRIASTEAYKGVESFQPPSDSYKKKAFEISQRRMALAGYRIADEFNDAFGAPATPAGPAAPGQQ